MYSQKEDSFAGATEERLDEEKVVLENVSKLQVLPPDYDGEPVKGHLIFDADFESGNLGKVDYVSECEYDLFIRPDTNSPRHRVWFYFSVKNARAEQRVVFNVVNYSKNRSLYRDGMAPVVRSSSRPRWRRIPSRHACFQKSPAHNDQYVISFAFEFDREDDMYFFAFCFPYTYTKLQQHLTSLDEKRMPYFHREVLASSQQGRRLDLITITDPTNLRSSEVQKVIFITARVHPGESPASILCQGLIDFLVSDDPVAATLRHNFVFKIIPMLNPDGVFLGNGRCTQSGFDLNRKWERPLENLQPTIFATRRLLMQYNKDPLTHIEYFIDLHSHSLQLNSFMYGNVFSNDAVRCQRQAILPALLSEIAEDFSLDLTQFNKDPLKAGTGRRVLATLLSGQSMCFTFEVSIYGYVRKEEPSEIIPYTEESYQDLGRNLAYSFYQYLRVERGIRSAQTRPFHSFLPKSSSTAPGSECNPPMAKCNHQSIEGVKRLVKAPDETKTNKNSSNRCPSRIASNPGLSNKFDRLQEGRRNLHQTNVSVEES